MIIKAQDISVSYTRNAKKGRKDNVINIIDPVDITIVPGKVTVIFGRSGSGKTTLLSVLAGLLKPSEGTVLYDDIDIYKQKDDIFSEFRNQNIGFIPQGQSLISGLTVRENILLPARESKRSANTSGVNAVNANATSNENNAGSCTKRADDLISTLGLLDRADYLPSQLSGGEIRRCAIARALINDPSVIFADEPTGDLDDHNTKIVFELLRQKARDDAAVVIVTHEETAYNYADIVYRMDAGALALSA
ncbi:ABC transporter ATP-binding protein [Butyrivibrio fibrisolvens]|jgi:ABC-type lipoprotein export system ATPase subunit|uniref:ABC transporter ATP-binding protein n=1 Tax=Butyrivibrio fibrisolvens TaxID=831 RepID=UPI0003F612A4|nr:ABC transporter ATP-binding protein [Butyrivibrio fibrisolvens]